MIRRTVRHARENRSEAGFTLSELLVASTLALIGLAMVGTFQRFQLQVLRTQATQLNVQSTARSIVDLFAREVRRACSVTFASESKIAFLADLDNDGAVDGEDEDVAYYYSGGDFFRFANDTAEPVVTGLDLTGTKFSYFDSDGNQLVVPPQLDQDARDSILRVRVEFSVKQEGAEAGTYVTAKVSTDIELRNRFFVNEMESTGCSA